MTSHGGVLSILVLITLLGGALVGAAALEPSHDRPYLMPASERTRIQHLTTTERLGARAAGKGSRPRKDRRLLGRTAVRPGR